MQKSLDQKITRMLTDPDCRDFILADAKDADMAFGLSAPGTSPEYHGGEARFRTLAEYRQLIRDVVHQGLVDITLMSASTNEILTLSERLFDNSTVTPAIRANDTTDIWLAAGSGRYPSQPARPFRSARLDQAMCGSDHCTPNERKFGADLGLYSITLNNDVTLDHETLVRYGEFRAEAASKGFRHFLEVFAPNACGDHCPSDIPSFVNDSIVRNLAGVTSDERPLFLKIPYFGPPAMESLVSYDSRLIVGILGGSAGTTFDAFQMLWEAKKYGARVALYGRKINSAEHQTTFVAYLRAIADGNIRPSDAVRAYHNDLSRLRIRPHRRLEDDLQPSETSLSYDQSPSVESLRRNHPAIGSGEKSTTGFPTTPDSEPDFSRMTQAEKVQWNLAKWRRILG